MQGEHLRAPRARWCGVAGLCCPCEPPLRLASLFVRLFSALSPRNAPLFPILLAKLKHEATACGGARGRRGRQAASVSDLQGAPAMAPCSSSTVSWTAARTRRCMPAWLCALAFVAGLVTCGEKLAAACVISVPCLLAAAACALAVTDCRHFCQMPALVSQACSQRRGRRREEHA